MKSLRRFCRLIASIWKPDPAIGSFWIPYDGSPWDENQDRIFVEEVKRGWVRTRSQDGYHTDMDLADLFMGYRQVPAQEIMPIPEEEPYGGEHQEWMRMG